MHFRITQNENLKELLTLKRENVVCNYLKLKIHPTYWSFHEPMFKFQFSPSKNISGNISCPRLKLNMATHFSNRLRTCQLLSKPENRISKVSLRGRSSKLVSVSTKMRAVNFDRHGDANEWFFDGTGKRDISFPVFTLQELQNCIAIIVYESFLHFLHFCQDTSYRAKSILWPVEEERSLFIATETEACYLESLVTIPLVGFIFISCVWLHLLRFLFVTWLLRLFRIRV